MNKLILSLLVAVIVLELCKTGHGFRRRWGHGRRHGGGGRRFRPMADAMRRRPNRRNHNWFTERPGRFNLGMGHDKNPAFNFDLDLSWGQEAEKEPWWSGPNVCFSKKEERVNETDEIAHHFNFQSIICDGSDTVFKCVRTKRTALVRVKVTEVYECCLGYTRSSGEYGCETELPMMEIPELLETLELTEMIQFLDSAGVDPTIFNQEDANFTVFAPSNAAFTKFRGVVSEMSPDVTLMDDTGSLVMVSEKISNDIVDNSKNILLGHVVSGLLTTPQFTDNMMVETASPYKSFVRVNTYTRPIQLVTANCKKMSNTDNMATNGVVHIVDDILEPVTETLLDIIRKNPELSILKTVIGSSEMGAALKDDEGQITLLAPTDSAFKKYPKLLNDKKCLTNILKSHIFPDVVCSGIIQGQTKTRNLNGKYTNLSRTDDDKVYADGAQVIAADVMATNGVLHIIDDVIIPDEGRTILELAETNGLTSFSELVEKAGLKKDLDLAENVTVFAPTNEAIEALPSDVLNTLASNRDELRRVLLYHVVQSEETCHGFYNNKQLETLSPGNAKMRINEYSSFPFGRKWIRTAQCSEIDPDSLRSCNGIVQVVNKVMIPPTGNVVDVLAKDKRFSTLVDLVKRAKLADELQGDGPFTIFAPTNDVFNELGSDVIEDLLDSPKTLKTILLNHVTKDFVCCAGIQTSSWMRTQTVRTLSGEVYSIKKDRHGDVIIDEATVGECDVTATNGVVHVIDRILMEKRRSPWQQVWDLEW